MIMSVYRDRGKLAQSVASVLNQTFQALELIVIDDGSPDHVWDVLQEFRNNDARVIVLRNKINLGLTRSLNRGLEVASGEYIARIDEGEVWVPKKLERQVAFLDENPDYVLVGTRSEEYSESGRVETAGSRLPLEDRSIREWLFLGLNPMTHSAIMFRRGLLAYNDRATTSQDFELYLRLCLIGRMHNFPEIMVRGYRAAEGISLNKQEVQFFNHLLMHKQFLQVLKGSRGVEEYVRNGTDFDKKLPWEGLRRRYMRACLRMLNEYVGSTALRRVLKNLFVPDMLIYLLQKRTAPFLMRRLYVSWVGRG